VFHIRLPPQQAATAAAIALADADADAAAAAAGDIRGSMVDHRPTRGYG